MTEREKMVAGLVYDASDVALVEDRVHAKELCFQYNQLSPSKTIERKEIIKKLFAVVGNNFHIEPALYCDYGYNIEIGENFYSNHNCVILDVAKVTFGNNVFVAPNCGFYTAAHPLDPETRNKWIEFALPIKVGNSVWIGGNVVVLPGVTIGDNCVIGAGSVVTKNIPSNVVAFGNPCRVIREITEADKKKYIND